MLAQDNPTGGGRASTNESLRVGDRERLALQSAPGRGNKPRDEGEYPLLWAWESRAGKLPRTALPVHRSAGVPWPLGPIYFSIYVI